MPTRDSDIRILSVRLLRSGIVSKQLHISYYYFNNNNNNKDIYNAQIRRGSKQMRGQWTVLKRNVFNLSLKMSSEMSVATTT